MHKLWEWNSFYASVLKMLLVQTHICTSSCLSNGAESCHFWSENKCMSMINAFLLTEKKIKLIINKDMKIITTTFKSGS